MTAGRRLRALANEAYDGYWFSQSYLRAFIDDDDGQVFTEADVAYIAALDPALALAIADLIDAAETVGDRMIADGGGDRWWQAHDALGVALARVAELL